ncbi:MAG: glycosyltransferase, partial [Schwartzia sp.]|nr:glycosyltransferase [Schwartzia sp. (in: firmicutes)]
MKNNKIKIAAYAITRNESKNLPMWLDTVSKITDVIILADSASTDGTREMAQKFGAKVIDYEWQNDFAAARNFALSKIPRDVDWVVGLDAD